MNFEEKPKSYPITKKQVWEAFKLVKSAGGSAGVDGITIEDISKSPEKHLYPVWNRMASGSYFPEAVKRVEIPKTDGRVRQLGIPTVKDRVAQMVITKELEAIVEPLFSENSFGYRPHKSAHQAVDQARTNCWKYAWVIDMDIKGFFDTIDHGLMIRILRHYTDRKHIITYVKRWLKAPIQEKDGTQIQNTEKGTPQGGVISPLLANIFLHVVFDKWMESNFPDCPFERYADDIVVHVKNESSARNVLEQIGTRMESCKLTLHPDKTKIVFCDQNGRKKSNEMTNKSFDFLGFTFRTRSVMTKAGKYFKGFSPSISKKAIKRIIKECYALGFHRWTQLDLHGLSKQLSSKIRGWINYYGRFRKSGMTLIFRSINRRLTQWAFNKYKRFKRRKTHYFAREWMMEIAKNYSYLFPHWQHGHTRWI